MPITPPANLVRTGVPAGARHHRVEAAPEPGGVLGRRTGDAEEGDAVRRIALLLTAALIAACGPGAEVAVPVIPTPIDTPDADPAEVARAAEATNAFGFDLLTALRTADDGNVVISPVSVAAVLHMIANGAVDQTLGELEDALHVTGWDEDERNAALGALLRTLSDATDVDLTVASSLWAREGTAFERDYIARVTRTFDAVVEEVDLGAADTAERIDDWVAAHTEGLIDEIAEDLGLPDANAVLVLLNAVYFLGTWTYELDPADTRDGEFTRADGTTVTVPFMHASDLPVATSWSEDLQVLALPYGDDERFAMQLFLPAEGRSLDDLLEGFDAATWAQAVAGLGEPGEVAIAVPKLEVEWDAELNDPLGALGVEAAFRGGFTRMSPVDPFLSVVVHKTYLRMDEEGTEAAAVTGGVMAESAPMELRVDRPFLLTISDTETGAIVFAGAITDPS